MGGFYTPTWGREMEKVAKDLPAPESEEKLTEEPAVPEETQVAEQTGQVPVVPLDSLGQIVAELMRPVMQTVGQLLENNTAALEQLSSAQSIQNDRLEALEKQIRLQTPVSSKQVTYLNDAIRSRSRELLDKREIDDKKAVTKLGNQIRKAVLSRYGISSLREIPKHEYNVALSQVSMWNDVLVVRDVVKDARNRMEGS